MKLLTSLTAIVVAGSLLPQLSYAQEQAGTATSVISDVTATAGAEQRTLQSGQLVFRDELIQTEAEAAAVLDFLDKSKLQLGPNAQVTLDAFVYDPDSKTGTFELTIKNGFLTMASGALAPGNYVLNTPVMQIGIRGTEFRLRVEDDGDTQVGMISGAVTGKAQKSGRSVTIAAGEKGGSYFEFDAENDDFDVGDEPETFKDISQALGAPTKGKDLVTKYVIEKVDLDAILESCAGKSDECVALLTRAIKELEQPGLNKDMVEDALKDFTKTLEFYPLLSHAVRFVILETLSDNVKDPEIKQDLQEQFDDEAGFDNDEDDEDSDESDYEYDYPGYNPVG